MTADLPRPALLHARHGKRLRHAAASRCSSLIEITDVIFAVDSIPAILAVSREPFIVFASNAFAILGLRALYFLLAGPQDKLVYLNRAWPSSSCTSASR